MSRRLLLALVFVMLGMAIVFYDWHSTLPEGVENRYVGTDQCVDCHQREAAAWRGSHHDLAMDTANEKSVIGDFDNAAIEHYGLTSTLYRDGQRYMVRTEGPEGETAEFEVTHVFGVEPLQQYLVELDAPTDGAPENALGRLQVLPFCWDVEQKEWYYLSPPDVDERLSPDDPLHWTGYAQNWNHMCAACHSTDLKKGYDLESGTFATTYADIDVGCEACHGPGSTHVELASARSLFWDRRYGKAITKFNDLEPQREFETCGPCHAHRQDLHPGFAAGKRFYDHYVHATIAPDLYYPDGQIRSEVYVLGSYMQSKMYSKGVRCSACHDPHSNHLKFEDNRLCTSCHQHPAAKYDSPAHHQHGVDSTGASCVACHMPETPYMEIDLRRDHSMKIPRPDRSVALGVPNACTGCHLVAENVSPELRPQLEYYADWLRLADKHDSVRDELNRVNEWAAWKYRTRYGEPKEDSTYDFAEVFHEAWTGATDRREQLSQLTEIALEKSNSAIVRASALEAIGRAGPLSQAVEQEQVKRLQGLLRDRHAFVRANAASLLGASGGPAIVGELAELLGDPIRMVRVRAAEMLAAVPDERLTRDQARQRQEALEDYREGLMASADQTGSHMALGGLAERQGADREAVQHYLNAIKVQPNTAGPRSNLANVLQRIGADESAEQARAEELPLLARDAGLVPDNMAAQYRYAMALYLDGQTEKTENVLLEALDRNPRFEDARYFLALLFDKQQRHEEALQQAEALLKLNPANPRYQQLLQTIEAP